jgi:hypothetical protein
MATISKHGEEFLRIERLADKIAYFSDGKILRNQGNGWKLWRKVKPGVDLVAHAAERKAFSERWQSERPAYTAFKREFHAIVSFSERYMFLTLLQTLANDPDGVWVEANDMLRISIGVEECCDLCRLYEAYAAECKSQREESNAVPA